MTLRPLIPAASGRRDGADELGFGVKQYYLPHPLLLRTLIHSPFRPAPHRGIRRTRAVEPFDQKAIMNRHSLRAAGLLLVSCALAACDDAEADPSKQRSAVATPADSSSAAIWQLGPVALLAKGEYGGTMTITEVLRHGNMGVAGADALNGEMALVDGKFYQFLADGQVVQPPDSMRLPWGEVTFWNGGSDIPVSPGLVYNGAGSDDTIPAIDSALDLNAFYAVRMGGSWDTVVVRTFRQQTLPYPPLDSAVKTQVVDTLVNVTGTMVGFRQPRFSASMGLANYHLHFVSGDRAKGGHVLGFVAREMKLQVSERPDFTVHMRPARPPASP